MFSSMREMWWPVIWKSQTAISYCSSFQQKRISRLRLIVRTLKIILEVEKGDSQTCQKTQKKTVSWRRWKQTKTNVRFQQQKIKFEKLVIVFSLKMGNANSSNHSGSSPHREKSKKTLAHHPQPSTSSDKVNEGRRSSSGKTKTNFILFFS